MTGVPPRSRRKAAEGIRARAMRPLWENADEESRRDEEDCEFDRKLVLGLGFGEGEGEGEREEEEENVGKFGADMEEEMKARWREY